MRRNKLISSVIIGGLILSTSSMSAFAVTANSKAKAAPVVKPATSTKASNTAKPAGSRINAALQTQLDGLVKKGTLTKAQETKVMAALNKRNTSPRGQYGQNPNRQNNQNGQNGQNAQNGQNGQNNNFQNMTPEQRQAFMQKAAKNRPNPLADLVKAKTITQKQSDAINALVAASRGNFRNNRPNNNPNPPQN
jgi:hypothetical protein